MGIQSWAFNKLGHNIEVEKIVCDEILLRKVTARLLVDGRQVKGSYRWGLGAMNLFGAGNPIAAQVEGADGKLHLVEVMFPSCSWDFVRVFVDGQMVFKA